MHKRAELLLELLAPRRPINLITAELARFPWDSDSELVILNRNHLRAMLGTFIADQMTVVEIEAWAEAIEGRDDVGFESEHEELLKTIIFELSTQDLGAPLTRTRAERLINELSEKPRKSLGK
jgi:hypothetical protein